jgi:hypothetical protein
VVLDDQHRAIIEAAARVCGGPPACRKRKLAEAHDLLAMAQLTDRLKIHWLDLSADLRVKLEMRVPVGCLPDPAGPLQIAPWALLGVVYPEQAVILPQPGHAFVRILEPRRVWHSNVTSGTDPGDPNQLLCLGPSLPAGTPLKEILLMTYGALSLQTTQMDWLDSAGLLNPAAADWWQRNPHRIPLTKEPFLQKEAQHAH